MPITRSELRGLAKLLLVLAAFFLLKNGCAAWLYSSGEEGARLANPAPLSCEGSGQVQGALDDVNMGSQRYQAGVAWRFKAGIVVLLTQHRAFARTLAASADIDRDLYILHPMFNAAFTQVWLPESGGTPQHNVVTGPHKGGSGFGGMHGSFSIDQNDCVRGTWKYQSSGEASFALPLWNAQTAALFAQTPEAEGAKVEAPAPAARPALKETREAEWAEVHAFLMQPDPSRALLALGLTESAAAAAAQEPQALAALERLRSQCPAPERAEETITWVAGEARPAPGIVLESQVITAEVADAAALRLCEVSAVNGVELRENCEPIRRDCSR